MTTGRALPAAVLVLALAACGGGNDAGGGGTPVPSPVATSAALAPSDAASDAASTPAPADTATVPADGPVVTLLDPGQEPRTELRYQIANRRPVDATVRQRQKLEQTIAGQSNEVDLTTLFDIVGGVQTEGDTFTMRASLENYRLGETPTPRSGTRCRAASTRSTA